jgi:hypothetical protein
MCDYATATEARTVVLGLVADPGLPRQLAQRLAAELPDTLAERVGGGVRWEVRVSHDALTLDAEQGVSLRTVARERMPSQGWDLMVWLTDLPRRNGTRPIVADLNIACGAALTSLPAIGWVRRQAHVRATLIHVVGFLAQETLGLPTTSRRHYRIHSRPTEWVSPVRQIPSDRDDVDVHLALSGNRGHARLLFGMVRDNEPWRLVPSLSKALAAASATAAFGVFFPSIWDMANALSPARLLLINFFAVVAMVIWLLIHNGLWESKARRADRKEAILYNASTVLSLFIGVACMYLLLASMTFLAALAVIANDYMSVQIGHPVGVLDYAALAWLASSMGTVAGALGSSLETEQAVRRATYSKRERARRARQRRREEESSA